MIKKMFTVAAFFLLVLYPLSARAVPIVGVAPGLDEYGESAGIYNDSKPESLDSYHKFFTKTFVDYGTEDKGWVVPESGGDLAIWFGNDSADPDDPLKDLKYMGWMDVDIWLLTDAFGAVDGGFYFTHPEDDEQEAFSQINDDDSQADGYFYKENGDLLLPPYYGVNLGSISDNPLAWEEIKPDYWPGEFWYYQGTIEYDEFEISQVDWFFVWADIDGDGIVEDSEVSPKTVSSSNPIPEPATMLLLGAGLIGLAGLGRKKFFRKS